MNELDKFRCQILTNLSSINSFKDSWSTFQSEIDRLIGTTPTASQIFSLGERLSDVFIANATSGRGQSDVSGGGAAWECLTTWYFNLIFWGTDVISTKQNKKFIPQVLYDAFCVTIANHKTNTESDVVVYSVPSIGKLVDLDLKTINALIEANIKATDTGIVQCKTNWNDNAQIPMLWDLIYNSTSFRIPNVSVGTNGYSPNSFGRFSYSFVTVPSNKKVIYKTDSTAVLRVKNLTGGNYWGKPTQQGICNGLNNFFGRNFGNHFPAGVQSHITNMINTDPHYYQRFRNLSF